nr:MAG TPA: hypothetical protein [Caudoviricetes sp.]
MSEKSEKHTSRSRMSTKRLFPATAGAVYIF